MKAATWKWLTQEPLAPTSRGILEIALAVVLAGAAMVPLGNAMKVDPSKIAKVESLEFRHSWLRPVHNRLAEKTESAPRISPDFVEAVRKGDFATMNELWEKYMPMDGIMTAAAENGSVEVLRWVLDHGADLHEGEGTAQAPLLMVDAHPDAVAFLFQRGAHDETLGVSANGAGLNAVTRLLAAHVPVNPPNDSPIDDALTAWMGTPETKRAIVEKLLDAGAVPSRESFDTLSSAIATCDRDESYGGPAWCVAMIDLLVAHNARAGGDALAAVATIGEPMQSDVLAAVMKAKIDKGATAIGLSRAWSTTPLVVKTYLAKGVDWGWRDGEDDAAMPLVAAVQRGDREAVRMMLDAGAPADRRYKDGSSALAVALDASGQDPHIIEMLVQHGASVNRRFSDGRTPLFAAAEAGELRSLNFLLDRGARVNDVILDDTALDAAEQRGNTPAARVLHAHGGRRNPKPFGQ